MEGKIILKVIKNIVLQDKLSNLRKTGIKRTHFRTGLKEMGRMLGYKFASTMDIQQINVKTPLGTAYGIQIKDKDKVVVVSVLRAAIPLAEGIMDVFFEGEYGMVGAWREDEPPFSVKISYIKIPDVQGKIVIVADPMIATGNTMNAILKEIKNQGTPYRLAILNLIATEEGVEKILESHSEVEIYTCSIENELKEGYIVPGLGDVGDIAFGKPRD